ncbi:MAG: GlsB/YeaQ/YmgE family stress response membrane protein [Actinomycetota bacterium]|nr:GlsB/YeaQ/YmgE family stress response membrane protein [Actinomycetota bacterium]
MIIFILSLIILGLIVGALARLLVPGRDPMGVAGTIGIGVVGMLISGFIGRALFGARGNFGSILFGLIITIGLVLLVRRMGAGRRV